MAARELDWKANQSRRERARRKKNEAFRRKLENNRQSKDEAQRLRLAVWSAGLIWCYVGVQWAMHH